MACIAFIHTVPAVIEVTDRLSAAHLPSWERFNILDESLLLNTIADGELSRSTMQRLSEYVFSAAAGGADAVVVTCSSLGDGVELIRPLSSRPLFRIDEGMARSAAAIGGRIGVLATLSTTLAPTTRLLARTAFEAGVTVDIVDRLCDGAFDRLRRNDRRGHDDLIVEGYQSLVPTVDSVVLAQASMMEALSGTLLSPDRPVLTSPELGIRFLAECLRTNDPTGTRALHG